MKPKEKTSQDQRKYLSERLETARRNHAEKIDTCKLREPPEVVAARIRMREDEKIIRRFDNLRYTYRSRRKNLLRKRLSETREVILFGSPQEALRAVEKFSRESFATKLEVDIPPRSA